MGITSYVLYTVVSVAGGPILTAVAFNLATAATCKVVKYVAKKAIDKAILCTKINCKVLK